MGLFDDNKKKIKDSILNDPALGESTDDGYYNGIYQKDLKKKGKQIIIVCSLILKRMAKMIIKINSKN